MTKCINNKCNKLKQRKEIGCISLYSYHESTVIIFYNNDMLCCTNNTHNYMSALFSWRSQRTLSLTNYLISVLGQWDPSFFRGCGKLIQLHLAALEQVSAN